MSRLTVIGKIWGLFIFSLWIYIPVTWIVNLVKLARLVSESPEQFTFSKHIIIHIAGLFPPLCGVLAWF